jgi:Flp pilus assembly protein TadD
MDPLAQAKQLFMDALALQEKGDLPRAEALYRQALQLAPERPSIMNNLAAVYFRQRKYAEAMQLCERLLQIDPRDLQALLNLGSCQIELGLVADALASYASVLELRPDDADALNNLGNALVKLQRPEEALAHLRRALAINPRHLDALQNHGNALLALGQAQEALVSYKSALALAPVDATVQYNLALGLLFCQEFELAWTYYAQRFESPVMRKELRRDAATVDLFANKSAWKGSAQTGQVAIWAEQGIGDHILFSTLIPELVEADVPFVYEVDRRLLEAYRRAFPKGHFVAQESPLNPALLQAGHALPAGSLPGLFRRSKASFARQPRRLLQALPERRAHYRDRMDALGAGLKVAFSWQSTRGDQRGMSKGGPLLQFVPLLELPGVHFVDVQYGDTRAERGEVERIHGVRLLHFDEVDYYNDLEEVLAILEACDLLITTSNANAHFAGALGKPVWLLYPAEKPPFHYWAHDGGHRCLWYPSVEIISAPHLADWPQLVEHVKARLSRDTAGLAQKS